MTGKTPPPPPDDFEAISLDHVPTEVQEWLHEPITPEAALILLVGGEGMGKGLFCAWENARFTKGICDDHKPKNVGLFSFEESLRKQIKPRHDVADAVLSRVFVQVNKNDQKQTVSLNLPNDIDRLRRFITGNALDILTIDPLISSFNGRIKPKDEKPVRDVLEKLQQLAEETGCTIRGLMHFNKNTGADVLDRIMHSKAFSAASRHTLVLGYDPEDPTGQRVALVVAKSNVWTIGDAIIFEKRSHGVGKNRRDGTEGTVGYLVEVGRRTGVDPRSVLVRPEAPVVDSDTETIRDLIKNKQPMLTKDFSEAMDASNIGYHKQRRIKKELAIASRRLGGFQGPFYTMDDDYIWLLDGGEWVATSRADGTENRFPLPNLSGVSDKQPLKRLRRLKRVETSEPPNLSNVSNEPTCSLTQQPERLDVSGGVASADGEVRTRKVKRR